MTLATVGMSELVSGLHFQIKRTVNNNGRIPQTSTRHRARALNTMAVLAYIFASRAPVMTPLPWTKIDIDGSLTPWAYAGDGSVRVITIMACRVRMCKSARGRWRRCVRARALAGDYRIGASSGGGGDR
jgi:hypothetical protein